MANILLIILVALGVITLTLSAVALWFALNPPSSSDPTPDPGPGPGPGPDPHVTTGDYDLVDYWSGRNFFDSDNNPWYFWNPYNETCQGLWDNEQNEWICPYSDPTHGLVWYGDWRHLQHDELIAFPDNKLRMGVEAMGYEGKRGTQGNGLLDFRKSTRIYTGNQYRYGLFIFDIQHMPEGQTVWPALWFTAAEQPPRQWACGGEIDLMESVNSVDESTSFNHVALHTQEECPQTAPDGRVIPCNTVQPDQDRPATGTCGCEGNEPCPFTGCGWAVSKPNTCGWGLNRENGGVYAMLWTESGIDIWIFRRNTDGIPDDITKLDPDPKKWGTPDAHFDACASPEALQPMNLVINTTLSGDWAGGIYPGGQEAADKYVLDVNNNPAFADAYWLINSVQIYKHK